MSQADEKLSVIAEQLRRGVAPPQETVRSFLLWFDAARRGYRVVRRARRVLRRYGLITNPDFEFTYIDGQISFQKGPREGAVGETIPDDVPPDPTYRIGRLPSAHRKPLSATPDDTLQHIVTQMMSNDFSQLPVMTGPRDIKGVVSWKSMGGRLALGRPCSYARDCMDEVRVLRLEDSLFSAISLIALYDYVLVQGSDKVICGIVTASDLNDQFRLLAEPFLLVGEIENGIRLLLHGKFMLSDLKAVKAPGEDARTIETPADLTFGEYVRLVEQESNWKKLRVKIDRSTFIEKLKRVRDIRNDVMHFDPDGLDEHDLKFLREFAQFLKRLRDVGAA